MTLSGFQALSQYDQIKKLFYKGVQLSSRQSKHFQVALYQLEAFYVEVFYDSEQGEITYVRAFDNMTSLDPYLEFINIKPILEHIRNLCFAGAICMWI